MDRDLHDDMLKLVRYKVLFVKREYEYAFPEREDLVSDNLDGTAFAAWKTAEFIQELAKEQTRLPAKWADKGYPGGERMEDEQGGKKEVNRHVKQKEGEKYLVSLPDEDKKYLRVYYEVLERYPREKFKYEEQQIRVLEQIRDKLSKGKPDKGKEPKPGQVITNSIGMRLVEIPAGHFMMGSPDWDKDANPDEKPRHAVLITKPFYLGVYEVTVGQFKVFVKQTSYKTEGEKNGKGSTGLDLTTGKVETKPQYNWHFWLRDSPQYPSGFNQTDEHPVVCVSWNDAREFCKWLSQKEGKTYRLPTEAEWEYACRAGTTTRYYCGNDDESLKEAANIADASLQEKWVWRTTDPPFPQGMHLPPYARPWNDGYPFTAPVGRFKPNAFGLYDMHGNVGEWCSDWYDENYYAEEAKAHGQSPSQDPRGPDKGQVVDISDRLPDQPPRTLRVIRGGVWLDPATGCRSADRMTHRRHPVDSAADIGFRVVREY